MKSKSQYRAINDRNGSEVYAGPSEKNAATHARKAAEDNAQHQHLEPDHGSVWKDGRRVFYYVCDPTVGRVRARKILLT